jgi:hypothetical protein
MVATGGPYQGRGRRPGLGGIGRARSDCRTEIFFARACLPEGKLACVVIA